MKISIILSFIIWISLPEAILTGSNVTPVTIRSSLINISLRGENMNLTIDFLNKYIQHFLDDNLAKKNKMSG
jgi:riboflavin synthase alpha subunit